MPQSAKAPPEDDAASGISAVRQSAALRMGDSLFQEGNPRTHVYRIDKGAIAVFERRIDMPPHIIEMVGVGEYVGLGCLEHHRDNARAVVESIVTPVPREEFGLIAERNPKLSKQQQVAVKRDFEYGKMLAHDRGKSAPLECVAALLVAVSRQNEHEGRNAAIISDTLRPGVVTILLDLDVTTLTCALRKLRDAGLVTYEPSVGLRITDIPALERVANGDLHGMDALDVISHNPALPTEPLGPLATRQRAITGSAWKGELREAAWLVSVIGGLSMLSVAVAIMVAFAVQ